jgi:hypothetical protein
MREPLELSGLDGSNPLAFLAALGTLRTLSAAWPDRGVGMSWRQSRGAWRPLVHGDSGLDDKGLVDAIVTTLGAGDNSTTRHPHLGLGKNLSVLPRDFAGHARQSADACSIRNRRWADFVASFGCEILTHAKLDRIVCTEFCFLFGSGNQHYLKTMAGLLREATQDRLREALFGPWTYTDLRLSMRWDPVDRREHAYRWTAPTDEATSSVWGANLLAVEGSSLYPTLPAAEGCPTTGFCRAGNRRVFTWPIWTVTIGLDVVRSLIALRSLQPDQPDYSELRARGIATVFRATKVKVGEGANFKWSFTPAEAV